MGGGAATTTPSSAPNSFASTLSKSAFAILPRLHLQHPEPCLLAQFKVWLRKHAQASDRTIKLYARDATHLMGALEDRTRRVGTGRYSQLFLDRASHCGNGTVEKLTTSLRAFLRYLAVKGRCRAGLADVVPGLCPLAACRPAANIWWRSKVNRLIAACDGEVVARRRDRAIVLLFERPWAPGRRRGATSPRRYRVGDGLRCGSPGQVALRSTSAASCKTSVMRLSPTSRAALRLARAIYDVHCAISRRIEPVPER